MAEQKRDYEIPFDGEILEDAKEFIVLQDGEYDFEVTSFEKGRFAGKDGGLPPCNMVTVFCKIETDEGVAVIKSNLFLHSRTEGILSSFFASIGQKRKGEPLKMQWNLVIGSKGRCKVSTREYNGNTYNDIKRFIPAEERKTFVAGSF